MKFDVSNRFTRNIQFTAEIDCKENETTYVKMGLAIKWAIETKAYLGGAYLGGADLRDADLGGAYLGGADLGDADLREAYLRGAYLRGAYLGGSDLRDADLGSAYLRDADLRDADLGDADLRGAYLGGADLRGADLGEQWIIQGPCRSDGYFFFLTNLKNEEVRVKAGCRNFNLEEAYAHWNYTRKGTKLGEETILILKYMEKVAKLTGHLK